MLKEFEAATFAEDIKTGPVLLDFYSKTCGPCKMLGFMLADLDKNYGDDVKIIKIDFEEQPDLVAEYKVEGYPTLVMLKDGEEIDRKQGLQQKPVIEKLVESAR